MKQIIVKWAGKCAKCGTPIAKGEMAYYSRLGGRGNLFCTDCGGALDRADRSMRDSDGTSDCMYDS